MNAALTAEPKGEFREVLGYFATGIAVVTGVYRGAPVGMAANSFTSVSLEPPLVGCCPAHSSTTWPKIRESGGFCVNIMGSGSEEVCRRFAIRGAARFDGIDYREADSGRPIVVGAIAWIDCAIEAEHTAGDHCVVVGRVLSSGVLMPEPPLLFFRGKYGTFAKSSPTLTSLP